MEKVRGQPPTPASLTPSPPVPFFIYSRTHPQYISVLILVNSPLSPLPFCLLHTTMVALLRFAWFCFALLFCFVRLGRTAYRGVGEDATAGRGEETQRSHQCVGVRRDPHLRYSTAPRPLTHTLIDAIPQVLYCPHTPHSSDAIPQVLYCPHTPHPIHIPLLMHSFLMHYISYRRHTPYTYPL